MRRFLVAAAFAAALAISWQSAMGAGQDTADIKGPAAQTLMGDGTGIIIGLVDSGVDTTHPWLTGTVSSGQPRLVAEANFVTSEPTNTGQDVYGHGTATAGQILSRNASHEAVATDARYIDARVLDSTNSFASDAQVANGIGFAVSNGANIINLSLNYGNANTSGDSYLSMLADYLAYGLRIPVTVSAGNTGTAANHLPEGPADAFNVFSVGSTSLASNYTEIVNTSSYGLTTDGRNAPNIAAPGDQVVTAQMGTNGSGVWSGTSFAAPNVAGILAAQMEYGNDRGLSVDPLVLRATILNSADKIEDRNGNAWAPNSASTVGGVYTVTSPLNASAGAGQIDGASLYAQYAPGDHAPGNVPDEGWDMHTVTGTSTVSYNLGDLEAGTSFSATLDWLRHVGWTDTNGNGIIDSADTFTVLSPISNLYLYIYRNGTLIADSISNVDTIQQLDLTNIAAGDYTLDVTRAGGGGSSEEYGLAWDTTAVPEPKTIVFLGMLVVVFVRRARHQADVVNQTSGDKSISQNDSATLPAIALAWIGVAKSSSTPGVDFGSPISAKHLEGLLVSTPEDEIDDLTYTFRSFKISDARNLVLFGRSFKGRHEHSADQSIVSDDHVQLGRGSSSAFGVADDRRRFVGFRPPRAAA